MFIQIGRKGTPEAGVLWCTHLQCLYPDEQRLVAKPYSKVIDQVIGLENVSGVKELRGEALEHWQVFKCERSPGASFFGSCEASR